MTVLISNPIWLAKTRLCQSGANTQYTGLYGCLKSVWVKEGIKGWYRGIGAGLLGTSHGAVQFVAYERLKKLIASKDGQSPTSVQYLMMSSASKIVASTITYPYQVIRCRLQLSPITASYKYNTIFDVVGKTWRGEGIIGFYKGLVPNTIRVLPGTCITFLVYERLAAFFKTMA